MKVLYVIDQDIEGGNTSGIVHKVKSKISQWSEEGVDVELLSLYSFKLYDDELRLKDDKRSFLIKKHGRLYTLFRLIISTYLLSQFLKNNNYDLMYIRQRPYMPFTQRCFDMVRTVVEINTYDVGEYKSISKVMYHINNMTRDFYYKKAKGLLCVSRELEKIYRQKYSLPTVTIANGINTRKYRLKGRGNSRPQLAFIGSPGFDWHGIEKIELMARRIPEFDFHLIGVNGANKENVFFHNYCSLSKAQEIVSRADVGICSLSLHTKGMQEASPLKSRQYLAQGLPIIYAYKDTDMSGDEKFALRLENSPDNVEKNIDMIKAFVFGVAWDSEISMMARAFSENVLDSKIKEKQRILFFKRIIDELE